MLKIGLIFILLLGFGCGQKKQSNSLRPMANNQEKVVIYQMMTRLFGNKKQVNKPYGTLEENGVGKFDDITQKALAEIKELGISHVWYTGVLEHAVLTDYTTYGIPLDDADVVKGRAGSPYAIKDYYDINPDLANDVDKRGEEFDALVNRTHEAELKVIIDFVPNHVARGYKSDAKPKGVADLGERDNTTLRFDANNSFYYLPGESFRVPSDYHSLGENSFPTKDGKFIEVPAKATGNNQFTSSPGMNDWFETIKLNYGIDIENGNKTYFDPIPETWIRMKDILVFWTNKKVDGFRCDMAEMVPVEFWHWAIPQVKRVNPDIIFIAEIYNPEAYRRYIELGGFDFLYDKVQLYDTLRLLITGASNANAIPVIQNSLSGINKNMLHFLENHDEQRIASGFFAGDPFKALPAVVISATVDQGPLMIYFGQEVGEPGLGNSGFSTEDGRTTIFDYWGVPEHQKWMNEGAFDGGGLSQEQKNLRGFYKTLLTISKTNRALVEGAYIDLTLENIERGNIGGDVVAYIRYHENEKLIVVAGFAAELKSIKIAVPSAAASQLKLSTGESYEMMDLLSGKSASLINNQLQIELPPFGAYIFKIKNS